MSSSDYGKLESDVEIKASAAKFHEIFTQRPHHLSNVSSDKVQACDLHEGEWGTVGAIITWNYVEDGKKKVAKELIEAVDAEKNMIRLKVIEGDLLEHFKSFVATLEVTPKVKSNEAEGSIVHWTFEYEKHHHEIVDPQSLLQFTLDLSKDIDDHLVTTTA